MTLLSLYPPMIKELAPRRANDINSVNEMRTSLTFRLSVVGANVLHKVENHPQIRDASRRKAMKAARRAIKVGLENQRVRSGTSFCEEHQ